MGLIKQMNMGEINFSQIPDLREKLGIRYGSESQKLNSVDIENIIDSALVVPDMSNISQCREKRYLIKSGKAVSTNKLQNVMYPAIKTSFTDSLYPNFYFGREQNDELYYTQDSAIGHKRSYTIGDYSAKICLEYSDHTSRYSKDNPNIPLYTFFRSIDYINSFYKYMEIDMMISTNVWMRIFQLHHHNSYPRVNPSNTVVEIVEAGYVNRSYIRSTSHKEEGMYHIFANSHEHKKHFKKLPIIKPPIIEVGKPFKLYVDLSSIAKGNDAVFYLGFGCIPNPNIQSEPLYATGIILIKDIALIK